MALNPNNFIASYKSSDVAIVFQNSTGKTIKNINVCKYLSNNTEENTLWVLMEGNIKLSFIFNTKEEASAAALNLQKAVRDLNLNCSIGSSGGGNPTMPTVNGYYNTVDSLFYLNYDDQTGVFSSLIDPESNIIYRDLLTDSNYRWTGAEYVLVSYGSDPIQILLSAYKSNAATGSLVSLHWYDVIDSTGVLGKGVGQVFRVFTTTSDDLSPQGIILGLDYYGNKITLDLEIDKIASEVDIENINTQLMNSNVSIEGDVKKVFIVNSSGTILGNTTGTIQGCENLTINNSIVNITNSENVTVFNSNVTLSQCSNCRIEEITGNLSTLPLVNVFINNATTIGKEGKTVLTLTGTNKTLSAYQDLIVQELTGTLSNNVTIFLTNNITSANSKFILVISPNLVCGNNKIIIRTGVTTLIEIEQDSSGKVFEFNYDKVSSNYYLLGSSSSLLVKKVLEVTSENQTTFNLNFTPTTKENSLLFINGIKYTYGISYTISGKILTWLNHEFSTEITDNIEIYYW